MKKVLFLCTGNSCRSQMAEGFLRHLAGDRYEVFSAGIDPADRVNPRAVKVMQEIGIDISHHRSKPVMDFLKQSFDHVITVCDHAKEVCPVFPGKYKSLHWNLEDPANATGTEEEKLAFYRTIRDQIKEHITEFLG